MKRTEIVDRIRAEAHKLAANALAEALKKDPSLRSYADKDRIIAPFYDIELETGVVISTLVMPKKEWENRPFLTPFQFNLNTEGILL